MTKLLHISFNGHSLMTYFLNVTAHALNIDITIWLYVKCVILSVKAYHDLLESFSCKRPQPTVGKRSVIVVSVPLSVTNYIGS